MIRILPSIAILAALAAPAHAAPMVHADYDMYAHGLHVATLGVDYDFSPRGYVVQIAYATTGLAGALFSGHQVSTARGVWAGEAAMPQAFSGEGYWRGAARTTRITYRAGRLASVTITPPDEEERAPVPDALRANTVDGLTALALVLRRVAASGTCDVRTVTYDGRRLVDLSSRTAGPDTVPASSRSQYAGPALRCDAVGQQTGGFLRDGDAEEQRRPKRGTAWIAKPLADAPPVAVRMVFETRWFGDATLYLTGVRTVAASPGASAGSSPLAADGSRSPAGR
jgi:hypothetical protein